MNKKAKITIAFAIIILSAIYITISTLVRDEKIDKLKANYRVISCGYITKFSSYRRFVTVYYAFEYQNKSYSGERTLGGIDPDDEPKFQNHTFPVMVDTTDPSNNAILITPHHFGKMDWKYPDSLTWVLKYYGFTGGSW